MRIVKVIIKNKVYEMTKEQAKGTLNVAKNLVPCGIYAVQKGDTIELKCQPYVYKQNLKKAVAEYVKRGFKVYYNGGQRMTRQQIEQITIENAAKMAKVIKSGKDVEIKTCSTGIRIISIDKKAI